MNVTYKVVYFGSKANNGHFSRFRKQMSLSNFDLKQILSCKFLTMKSSQQGCELIDSIYEL